MIGSDRYAGNILTSKVLKMIVSFDRKPVKKLKFGRNMNNSGSTSKKVCQTKFWIFWSLVIFWNTKKQRFLIIQTGTDQ